MRTLLALALGLAACSRGEPAAPTGAATAESTGASTAESPTTPFEPRAQAAVERLKAGLMGALQAAMADGGPESAVQVCNVEASGIAAQAGAGLDVGRVSHEPRNPANALAPWMAPAMARFEGTTAAKPAEPIVIARPDGRRAYFAPIYTGGLCLTCHGDAIPPGVAAKIAALYPDDRATGFAAGELRGLFRVYE